MSRHHDKWYTRILGDPRIVEELLRLFVHIQCGNYYRCLCKDFINHRGHREETLKLNFFLLCVLRVLCGYEKFTLLKEWHTYSPTSGEYL